MQRGGNLFPDRLARKIQVGHQNHILDAGQRIARRVGVNRRQGAFVTRVHGVQHVERFRPAHLTDDDTVRAHTQGVA